MVYVVIIISTFPVAVWVRPCMETTNGYVIAEVAKLLRRRLKPYNQKLQVPAGGVFFEKKIFAVFTHSISWLQRIAQLEEKEVAGERLEAAQRLLLSKKVNCALITI